MVLYVLFEHAAGYALFKVRKFNEIGTDLPQVEESTTDYDRFSHVVKLVSFSPFKSAAAALENVNSISEGILTEQLQVFLDKHMAKDAILGIGDSKIASSINDILKIKCQASGIVPEILRGVRVHFHKLVEGFTTEIENTAQLGLGHSYSRAKVKFNISRVDNMIVHSIALLDQLDKDINTFSMRIREWYSYHFPELYKIVPENYTYAKVANFIENRKDFNESKLEGLEEIVMDSSKAQSILDASRSSMGMDIQPIDLLNIQVFAKRVIDLSDYRKELAEYLASRMRSVAPNLKELIGDQVGARLIAHAGSLTNLAKYPASTVQILGAEKALFRALKKRTNTPKYGLIYHSTFIGRAQAKNKGRISRYLANKCSMASRIDCFSDNATSIFGEKLRKQVEDRLVFYDTGEKPKKNIDVMAEAMEEFNTHMANESLIKKKKKKKKDKKRTISEVDGNDMENGEDEPISNGLKKEKKKKKKKIENE
uniref:Nucleolar protein 56 n=1 Tax=Clastoptera arizonana TaxID=38151 RepID=A0A1B6D9N1_9HEMI